MEICLHSLVLSQNGERFSQNFRSSGVAGHDDLVLHPFALAPGGDNPRSPQIRQMARDFGLTLPENFNEVADANFSTVHQVQEPQPGAVG